MTFFKMVCHIKEIYVKKDGDSLGSADMDFWLTINGLEHSIGRFKGVEDPKTIKIEQTFEFSSSQTILNIVFKALDEDPSAWGQSGGQVADYNLDININEVPFPQNGLFIRAAENGVNATIYFDLAMLPEVADPGGYGYVKIFEDINGQGASRDLDESTGSIVGTYHFWLGKQKYQVVKRDYTVFDLKFPNDKLSCVILPGNVRVELFDSLVSDATTLAIEGQQGTVVNLTDYKYGDTSGNWNDRVTTIRTFTLNTTDR